MNKQEALSKFKTKTVHEIDYHEFENIVKSVYGVKQYSFVADNECGNESTHSIGPLKVRPLNQWESADITKFENTGKYLYLYSTLAQDLVNKGYFPEGEIIVEVYW